MGVFLLCWAAIDIRTGRNFLGERIDDPGDYLDLVIDRTFPFWAAGYITDVPKAGWEKGVAEWWGLRAWMVQYREQAREYAESHIGDIPDEMIMTWQKEKLSRGERLSYADLNNEQRAWLLDTFADYREAMGKVREDVLRRGTDFQVVDKLIRDELDASYHFELEELAKGVFAGSHTIQDFRDGAEYQRRIRQGQYQRRAIEEQYMDEKRVKSLERWLAENEKPEDVAYNKYMELRSDVPKVFGKPDWDLREKKLTNYLNTLDAETRDYIERRRDDWINSLPPNAQKLNRLIFIAEQVLDDYYAQPEGTARISYRKANPDVDVKLNLLGRVTTVKSPSARAGLVKWADTWDLPYIIFPALEGATKGRLPAPSRGGSITDEMVEELIKQLK